RGAPEEAEALSKHAVEIWSSCSGSGPYTLDMNLERAGFLCKCADKRQEGLEMLHNVMKKTQEQYRDDDPFTSEMASEAAKLLDVEQCTEEVEDLLRLSMRAWSSPRHRYVPTQNDADTLRFLGRILQYKHKFKEAEEAFRQAIDLANRFTP